MKSTTGVDATLSLLASLLRAYDQVGASLPDGLGHGPDGLSVATRIGTPCMLDVQDEIRVQEDLLG